MYVPPHFEETRLDVLHGLIRAHPFGTLVTLAANGLEANHIPFEIRGGPGPFGTLRGHVARANPVWRDGARGVEALVIFQGPSAYVSPSWYPTKQATGQVVPTWNYAIVHAYGSPRFIEDRDWLRGFVEELTDRYEAGRKHPWKITDAPADYIEKLLGAIVGIELPIARLMGKWKLGQNRAAVDQEGVRTGLQQDAGASASAMAELLREYKKL